MPVHGARRTAAPVYTPEVDETDPHSSFQHSSLTAEQKGEECVASKASSCLSSPESVEYVNERK